MNKIRVLLWGGIGDALMAIPALKALKQQTPRSTLIAYTYHPELVCLFKGNSFIDRTVLLSGMRTLVFRAIAKLGLVRYRTTRFQVVPPDFLKEFDAKQLIAQAIGVSVKDWNAGLDLPPADLAWARQFLQPFRSPVVMHTTSRCSKNHLWPRERWEQLVRRSPEYTFLQIGIRSDEAIDGAVDLREKVRFNQTAALIAAASAYVGVDSGPAHLAHVVGRPGVVLFGDSSPRVYGHSTHVNLWKPPQCSPCWNLLWGDRCPYSNQCMTNISVDEVMVALRRVVANGHRDRPQPRLELRSFVGFP